MTGRGVLAGASMLTHEVTSKPGWPLSMNVGTSGNAADRLAPGTPSPTSLPAFTYCCAVATAVKTSGICPPMTSMIACPPPLYGMCSSAMPVRCFRSSPARCGVPPVPDVP